MRVSKVRDIGRAIRARRLELGWSQTDLAEKVNTTRRWVGEIEHGKATAEVGLVVATLHALDITVHLVVPGATTRTEGTTAARLSSSSDLQEVVDRHVDNPRREAPRVAFRRPKR